MGTSSEKTPLWRILRYFRLRMRKPKRDYILYYYYSKKKSAGLVAHAQNILPVT